MPYFKFGGSKLHYTVMGKGKPVLMIHGMLESSKNIEPFAKKLKNKGFKCILVDLPFHGKTKGIIFSIDGIVASLKSLMTFLKIKEYQCFGFSLGAAICSILIRRDSRIKSMAVISPVISDFRPLERVLLVLLKSTLKLKLKYKLILEEMALDLLRPGASQSEVDFFYNSTQTSKPLSLLTDAIMAAQINTGLNLLYTNKPLFVVLGKYDKLSPPNLMKNKLSGLAKILIVKKGHSDIFPEDLMEGKKYLLSEFFKSTF
ncbi:MAG: alpha/beta hydrolase [Candidatus Altiarchaeota archaeon]|nr:alpha/beta hydrolase [Candidatus Altiarchaeota archaeon]